MSGHRGLAGEALLAPLAAGQHLGQRLDRVEDILRFGFTPLYLGFEDVWNAVEHLRQVLESGERQKPEFNQTHAVT